jgi:hypothetical protein
LALIASNFFTCTKCQVSRRCELFELQSCLERKLETVNAHISFINWVIGWQKFV